MITKGLFTSNSAEWATPKAFFEELDKKYNFDLDPCATKENAKCKRYFTKEENGLTQNWGGTTFFVIRHTVRQYPHGSRSVGTKAGKRIRWSLLYFRQGRTPNGFTSTYTTKQR